MAFWFAEHHRSHCRAGNPFGTVPGPATSPTSSAGCHRLIKEFGARIITDATDAAEL
ncbi:hypothetical protein [Cryobacterium levicorallinum]|uniref:hypothetical protein n=1 Tax=Cryobacterium levicorallinum TaxID=995038 RepID=UPI00118FFD72|nr:hypothetical protein [Cryobacterium levicorallinum]GEP27694.1 hypothetical protein CLE01_22920 [Cryobacterium levicorallinum]